MSNSNKTIENAQESLSAATRSAEAIESVTFEVVEEGVEDGRNVSRRGIYLLPNLLTTGALFCGFYAVVASIHGAFEKGAIALFAAMVLDTLDGRIARLTQTSSKFGAEYDSLSDLVAFGVAPALMMYLWSLRSTGKIGWMAAFIFLACAAMRLARFNTRAGSSDKRFFTGLPSPSAAGLLVAMIWLGVDLGFDGNHWSWLATTMTLFAAVLMVSNVPFPSFKEVDFKGRVPFVVMLLAILIIAFIFIDPPKVLLAGFVLYAFSGPMLLAKRYLTTASS